MKIQMLLISLASIVVILAGLKAASSIVLPFLLAIFIAIIIFPLITLLEKLKIPRIISFIFVSVAFIGALIFLGNITFDALADFSAQLPELQSKFRTQSAKWIDKINSYELINIDASFIGFDPNYIFSVIRSFITQTGSVISTSFFIFLLVAFMLFEVRSVKDKVAYLDKNNPSARIFVHNFIYNLNSYLLIKTISSCATGLVIGLCLWLFDIPYAPLWGVIAFVLNYIPTIGSIVAVFPALFVSLLMGEFGDIAWIIAIYLITNMLIGTIIEPKFLGAGLGISTIIVLLSLLVWGYVLGIGGLFLAVPLTMSLQIALATNPKTRFISVLLSNKVEPKDLN